MSESRDLLTFVAMANPVPDLQALDVDEVAAAAAAVETAWAAERSVTAPGRPVRRVARLRAVLVFAAAALLLLVLVGLPALLRSREGPVVDEPTTTTVPQTTTSMPATTTVAPATTLPPTTEAPPALTMTLEQLALDPVFESANAADITVGGPGLVAVGSVDEIVDLASLSISTTGASWVSTDGIVWERGGDLPPLPESVEPFLVRPGGVVTSAGGLLALGVVDEFTSVLWASQDGSEWTLVEDADLSGAEFGAVTSTETDFLLAGIDGDRVPSVWASADGTNWERMGDGPAEWAPENRGEELRLRGLATGTPGIVAWGSVSDEDAATQPDRWGFAEPGRAPAMWFSPDGREWQLVEQPLMADGLPGSVGNVAVGPDSFVALGDAIWVSTDGVTWTETGFDQDQGPTDAIWNGEAWIGIALPQNMLPTSISVWRSFDGVAWDIVAVGESDGEGPYEVAWWDGRLIGVGESSHPDNFYLRWGNIWVSTGS